MIKQTSNLLQASKLNINGGFQNCITIVMDETRGMRVTKDEEEAHLEAKMAKSVAMG